MDGRESVGLRLTAGSRTLQPAGHPPVRWGTESTATPEGGAVLMDAAEVMYLFGRGAMQSSGESGAAALGDEAAANLDLVVREGTPAKAGCWLYPEPSPRRSGFLWTAQLARARIGARPLADK